MVALKIAQETGIHYTIHDKKGTKLRNLEVLTLWLNCSLCNPSRSLPIEDCTSGTLEKCFVLTEEWWTTTFVWDFMVLIHHHFRKNCGVSNVYVHQESPGHFVQDPQPIPKGKQHLISIITSNNTVLFCMWI